MKKKAFPFIGGWLVSTVVLHASADIWIATDRLGSALPRGLPGLLDATAMIGFGWADNIPLTGDTGDFTFPDNAPVCRELPEVFHLD